MAEHGFTPGPWTVDPRYLSEVQTADDKTIASCWHKWADDQEIRVTGVLCCSLEESAANARLIAASPTLLEALEELEQRADEVVAALDKYNAENGTHLGGPPFFKIGVALAKARAAITLATGKDA